MKPIKNYKSQATTCRKEYKIETNDKFVPFYDDCGWHYYKCGKLLMYQYRQYRTWKHNRTKQYKVK